MFETWSNLTQQPDNAITCWLSLDSFDNAINCWLRLDSFAHLCVTVSRGQRDQNKIKLRESKIHCHAKSQQSFFYLCNMQDVWHKSDTSGHCLFHRVYVWLRLWLRGFNLLTTQMTCHWLTIQNYFETIIVSLSVRENKNRKHGVELQKLLIKINISSVV